MNPGETTATPGREARIVARRKRIEERIGAKAEGDGAPRPARRHRRRMARL